MPQTKVPQTPLSDSEYKLLVEYARRRKASVNDVLREAVRSLVLPDKVFPDDPLFVQPPSASNARRKQRTPIDHDKVLYRKKN